MKKLLVLVVTVAMLLSIAAVSLAAVTTTADFRYEIIKDASKTASQDAWTDNADFRIKFAGKVSDTIDASLMLRAQTKVKPGTASASLSTTTTSVPALNSNNQPVLDSNGNPTYVNVIKSVSVSNEAASSIYADEFFFNFKQTWGTVKVGAFDYKVHPSRILAKACDNNIFVERNPTMVTANIPIGETGLYTGGAYVIDGSSDKLRDNAYDFMLGYKFGKAAGVELHYYETAAKRANGNLKKTFNYDAYYQVTNTFKAYVYGTDPTYYNLNNNASNVKFEQETMLGLLFTKIAGTNLQASFEYSIDERKASNTEWDEHPYGVQAIYTFKNNLRLEYELTNVNAKNDAKNLFRFRVQF